MAMHLHDYLLFCFVLCRRKGKCLKSQSMELTKFLKEFTIILLYFCQCKTAASGHGISISSNSQILIISYKKKCHLFLRIMIFDRALLSARSSPQIK